MGFINWPQFYAAEAEKIKGGIFNDRKCIKIFFSSLVSPLMSSLDSFIQLCGQHLMKDNNGLSGIRDLTFCLSLLLSDYEYNISKILKSPKFCCKILNSAKAKAQNYKIE